MKRVILESPYAGTIWQRFLNRRYARRCVRHSLSLGEAPIASHLLYTQPGILNDNDREERRWGIEAGLAWKAVADASVVYTDRGISAGMDYGIRAARDAGIPVQFRKIDDRLPERLRGGYRPRTNHSQPSNPPPSGGSAGKPAPAIKVQIT